MIAISCTVNGTTQKQTSTRAAGHGNFMRWLQVLMCWHFYWSSLWSKSATAYLQVNLPDCITFHILCGCRTNAIRISTSRNIFTATITMLILHVDIWCQIKRSDVQASGPKHLNNSFSSVGCDQLKVKKSMWYTLILAEHLGKKPGQNTPREIVIF